jgi:hypothetical protein
MRLLFIALGITTLMFAPVFSNAQESLPLRTQMDANIQLIVESLMTALVGRAQVTAEDTAKVSVSPQSQLAQGLIVTEISSTEEAARLNGNLTVQISKQASDVILEVKLDVAVSKDLYFKTIADRIGTDAPATDFVSLKDKLSEAIANLEPQEQRPRQTFGAPTPRSTTRGTRMSQQSVDQLKKVLAEAIRIETIDNSQTMTVDLQLSKALLSSSAELTEVSKKINHLESLHMSMNAQSVSISMVSKIILPLQAVETYDQYLSQLQTKNVGRLEEVSFLISKIGPWAIGRCMHEKYQSVCIEKLLSSCVRSNSSLESCISLAENLQAAREARNEGDYLGIVTNGAEAAATSAFQSVENTISSWMNNEEEK